MIINLDKLTGWYRETGYEIIAGNKCVSSAGLNKITPWNELNYLIVTAASPSGNGNCDVFQKVENGLAYLIWGSPQVGQYWPQLNPDDNLRTARTSSLYNCHGFAGGLWEGIDPLLDVRWHDVSSDLQSFNNYYADTPTIRYPGATIYRPCNSINDTNRIVDLWASGSSPNYTYQHSSVRKPGNGYPHGYDYESKLGPSERTMHPRFALTNPNYYGSVVQSYYPNGTVQTAKMLSAGISGPLTFEQSVSLGFTVVEPAAFTIQEKAKIIALKGQVPDSIRTCFDLLYASAKAVWNSPEKALIGNLTIRSTSSNYTKLVEYCLVNGRLIWSAIMSNAEQGDDFDVKLIQDVILPMNENLLDEVNNERLATQYKTDGTFVYMTNKDIWLSFCKKMLSRRF